MAARPRSGWMDAADRPGCRQYKCTCRADPVPQVVSKGPPGSQPCIWLEVDRSRGSVPAAGGCEVGHDDGGTRRGCQSDEDVVGGDFQPPVGRVRATTKMMEKANMNYIINPI